MKKKAEISMQMIVFAIIALLVLVVVIFVFRDQIGRVATSFTGIGSEAGCEAQIATSGLFGKKCTPLTAVGPCMVSSEGACAAYYKYGDYKKAR